AEVEDDVRVVDDLDALHAGQIGLAARVGGRLVAVDVGFYRRPVERRTVLILDPRLQRELVVERVRHIPGLDQPRLDLQGRVDGEERVIDVVKDLAFDQKRGVEGIEGVQLAFESDRRGAAALGRARAVGGPSARAAPGRKQQQPYEGKGDPPHLRLLSTPRMNRPARPTLRAASPPPARASGSSIPASETRSGVQWPARYGGSSHSRNTPRTRGSSAASSEAASMRRRRFDMSGSESTPQASASSSMSASTSVSV